MILCIDFAMSGSVLIDNVTIVDDIRYIYPIFFMLYFIPASMISGDFI